MRLYTLPAVKNSDDEALKGGLMFDSNVSSCGFTLGQTTLGEAGRDWSSCSSRLQQGRAHRVI